MATTPSTDDGLVAVVRDLLVQLGSRCRLSGIRGLDRFDTAGDRRRLRRRARRGRRASHVADGLDGLGTSTQIQISFPQGSQLRFDQVAELYNVVRLASSASVSPGEALDRGPSG